MNKETTYVVVDIETTGTNLNEDRIIQIGCVFIQNDQIISRFAADVNPKRKISKQIQSLTGISNEQVAQAPYFEDIAFDLSKRLEGCVFVAHNIYFDYQFLNFELTRCGAPALTNAGVDTVELAQIFWPKSPSFRLNDLAEQAGVNHNRPHQADSDAEVTAELLLMIKESIKALPLVTLEKIVALADQCGMETQDYIASVYHEMLAEPRELGPNLEIINGLALQKKQVEYFNYQQSGSYPQTQAEKETLYGEEFEYRKNQGEMMNLVYDFFSHADEERDKNFALEVPTGSGKTFGYLLPLSYLATPEKPVIISTVSLLLESQIIQKAIPQVNQLRPESVVATLVKSQRHFIDLESFANTLITPTKQKQYALHQMGVLVWLTQTQTGELGELNLTTLKHRFFEQVQHRGNDYLLENSAFYEVDFWRHLQKQMKQANVIVVNHAFLCQENYRETALLPSTPYLIIDEAHHLAEIVQQTGLAKVNSFDLNKSLQHLFNDEYRQPIVLDLWELPLWQSQIKSLRYLVSEAQELLELFKEDWLEFFLVDYNYQQNQDIMLTNELLQQLPVYTQKHLKQFLIALKELTNLSTEIEELYLQELTAWTHSERLALNDWFDDLHRFKEKVKGTHLFFSESPTEIVRWFQISDQHQSITGYLTDFSVSQIEKSSWYQRFDHILYTGGTITVATDQQYLARTLGLAEIPLVTLAGEYDYSQQARLFVPDSPKENIDVNSHAYGNYVGKVVEEISVNLKRPMLVLFTSHEMLQKVYRRLHFKLLNMGIEVLAQGISGSREKIIKRFSHNQHSILLGTDSFWEGIDIPGEALKIIVVTRLPFESPSRPFVKEKYRYLDEQGINSFNDYALPKAGLRLRQGLGRLIRSRNDHGALVVLDRRLLTANYSQTLLQSLPPELPIIEGELSKIIAEMEEFL